MRYFTFTYGHLETKEVMTVITLTTTDTNSGTMISLDRFLILYMFLSISMQ